MKRGSERVRSRHLFVADAIGLTLSAIVALALWRNNVPDAGMVGAYFWIVGIAVFAHLAANIVLGLYTNSWRFASIGDMGRIIACAGVGSASAALIVLTLLLFNPPVATDPPAAAFWMLEATLALGVLATPRFMIRAASNLSEHVDGHAERERTLLYGAGWAGVMVARSAEQGGSGVMPVGFLDDSRSLKGQRIGGLRVYGNTTAMARAKRLTGATTVLITMPGANGANVRRVVDSAMEHGLDVRTVPAMTDLIDGTIDATHTRRVRVEDLLRRPAVTEHSSELQELLRGHTVMVTGAAGSIGSELVRQVLALEPGRIVMVDQAESAMYMVARDLETRNQVTGGATTITTHLMDVTDREAVHRLMCETEPVVVFHAAAYKHVPMLEEHAAQAARVNLGGTKSVIDAAIDCGVERFVLVSTDKAVRPSSVMGATKRIAEMIVSDAARRTGHAYVSVRFGNVLGSNGSVIPVFQSQLENGQPLTVTDREMTRYFMTIPEASWLILDAAALSENGSLYVLDMGEPVRIMDVANDLIRLSGRDPDTVPIRYIGLRPGEKLHEELFYDEESVEPTDVPKVMRSTTSVATPKAIEADVEGFLTLARDGRDDALRTGLLAYVLVTTGSEDTQSTADVDSSESALRPLVAVPVDSNGNGASANGPAVGTGANGRQVEASLPVAQGSWHPPAADRSAGLTSQKIVIRSSAAARGSNPDTPSAAEQSATGSRQD